MLDFDPFVVIAIIGGRDFVLAMLGSRHRFDVGYPFIYFDRWNCVVIHTKRQRPFVPRLTECRTELLLFDSSDQIGAAHNQTCFRSFRRTVACPNGWVRKFVCLRGKIGFVFFWEVLVVFWFGWAGGTAFCQPIHPIAMPIQLQRFDCVGL